MSRVKKILEAQNAAQEGGSVPANQKSKAQLAQYKAVQSRNQGRSAGAVTNQVVLKQPSLPEVSSGRLGDIGIASSSRRPEQIAKLDTGPERIQYLTASDRKLTKAEQEEARQIVGHLNAGFRSRFFEKRSPEDLQTMADIAALESKYKLGTQIGLGTASAFGGAALNKKATEVMGKLPGMPATVDTYQSAQTQNPVGFIGGQFAGEALKYGTAAKALGAIPKVGQALQSGSLVKRVATASAVDLPMDIASAALYSDGDKGQFAKELALNVGLGVGAGAAIEGIGKLTSRVKAGELKLPQLPLAKEVGKLPKANEPMVPIQANAGRDVAKSTPTTESLAEMPIQMQKTIQEYQNSVDGGIVEYAKAVRQGEVNRKQKYYLAPISEKGAKDVGELVGFDVTGYKTAIMPQTIEHIDNYHGVNGVRDKSMSHDDELARIQYVLDNYDNVFKGEKNSSGYTNRNGKQASTVIYTKRVNGTYYVIEAVPDASTKTNIIVSAFKEKADAQPFGSIARAINKKAVQQPSHAQAFEPTSHNATAVPAFSDTTISPTASSVNTHSMQNQKEYPSEFGGNTVGAAQSAYPKKQKVSKVRTNTIENSPMFTEVEKEMLKPDDYRYDVIGEKQSLDAAKQRLDVDFEGEVADLPTKRDFSGEDLDTSMGVLEHYLDDARATGDYSKVLQWSKTVQEKGTQGGQMIQAFAKYSRTPEGAVVKAQQVVGAVEREIKQQHPDLFSNLDDISKQVADIVKDGNFTESDIRDALGKIAKKKEKEKTLQAIVEAAQDGKTSPEELRAAIRAKYDIPTLTETEAKNIMDYMTEAQKHAEGSYERKMWETRAEQIIADKEPTEFREKFRGAQRISMLLNPKTLITRNPLGNVILGAAENAKDLPGTLIDKAASKFTKERTTSVSVEGMISQGKGFKQGVSEWLQDIQNKVDTSPSRGQMELPSKRIFENETVNALDQLTRRALQLGDRPFYQAAYNGRLKELEKLGKTGPDAEVQARLFALDRVFQNDSLLSQKAGDVRRTLGIPADLIMPFTQTPANVMDKLLDYSPVGLGKAMFQLGKVAKGKAFDQKLFVDRVARSFTGTGILMLGYAMAEKGLITGDLDNNKDVRNAQYAAGITPHAFKIGDSYYSFDWAQPIGGLLSIGANAQIAGKNSEDFVSRVAEGAEAGINTVFTQQFLQGVFNLFSGYNPASGLAKAFLGSTSQATPSAMGAIARTIDPYVRETYDPNPFAQQGKKLAARLPGISTMLPKRLDSFGQPVMQSQGRNLAVRAFENFLSPGKLTKLQHKDVYDELGRLYNETGSSAVFPNTPPKSFKLYGETVMLSAQEYEVFARTQGQIVDKNLEALLKSKSYESMPDEGKAEAVSKLYAYAGAVAKSKVSDYVLPNEFRKVVNAENQGVKPFEYYNAYAAQKDITGDPDGDGGTITGTETINKRRAIDTAMQGTSFDKRDAVYQAFGVGLSEAQEQTWGVPTVQKAVGSKEKYYKAQEIISSIKSDKDEYGNSISGTSKSKEISAIAKELNVSEKQANSIYNELVLFKHSMSALSSKQQSAYQELKSRGMSEDKYLKYVNALKLANGMKDGNGKTIRGSLKQAQLRQLMNAGMTSAQANHFYQTVVR